MAEGALSGNNWVMTRIAGEAIATKYSVVKLGATEGQVDLADTAGEAVVGVAMTIANSGKDVPVCVGGICKAVAGAAIDITTPSSAVLQANASAQVITASSSDAIIGMALQSATAAGDVISVLITSQGNIKTD